MKKRFILVVLTPTEKFVGWRFELVEFNSFANS